MRENEWNCKVLKERKMNEVSAILTDLTQLKPWNFHYFQWISLRSGSQNFAWDCFLTTRRLCTENLRGIFCSLDTGLRRLAPTLSKRTIFAFLSVRVTSVTQNFSAENVKIFEFLYITRNCTFRPS